MTSKKLIVIGGGAAGFFCAVNAARLNPELSVLILEKGNKILAKVRISGGGRCNVTHACFDIAEMSRKYPRGQHFVKKTFHQFFTNDTINWFETRGVALKTEPDGRMFPVTDSSQSIIDCLLREADTYGVTVQLHSEVTHVEKQEDLFQVTLHNGERFEADHVCIAAGGYPKSVMGNWIRALGHSLSDPVPSLFTFNLPSHPITALMGVSVDDVQVKMSGTKLVQTGPMLITHWGLSGPAVLKTSAWGAREMAGLQWKFSILVNWLPSFNEQSLSAAMAAVRSERSAQKIGSRSPIALPQRLWSFFLQQSGINEENRWANLAVKEQNRLVKTICQSEFSINGKTTFKEEFVTAGGVTLSEIDHNSMMSKKVNGLYFAGEVMDVDGVTGGFNFQHAWTSGFIAAKHIASIQ